MNITKERIKRINTLKKTFDRDEKVEIEKIAGLFPRGYLSIVASSAGTGKTWLTQYLACQLSLGGVILNGLVLGSKPMKSVIMSGETGSLLLNNRIAKTDWKYDPDKIAVYSALELGINDIDYMLNSEEGRNNIIAIVTSERPDIIWFDTLISFHSIDESKQGEMTQIYIFLNKIAHYFNCAVVCNHHTRKRPSDNPNRTQNKDDVIGTSAGVRLANTVYIASAEEEEGESTITVKNVKAWGPKVPPFTYAFTKRQGKLDFDVNIKVEANWSLRYQVQELIDTINVNTYIFPTDLAKIWGFSVNNIKAKLDEHIGENGELSRIEIANKICYRLKCWKDDYKPEDEYQTYIQKQCQI